MGKIGVLNAIESLTCGMCLKTIKHLTFNQENSGYYMSGHNMSFNVNIGGKAYIMFIVFDKNSRLSDTIINSANTIINIKIKDIFNQCTYLTNEFYLLDNPEKIYDVILFENQNEKLILNKDLFYEDRFITTLNDVGVVVSRMVKSALILNGDIFNALYVNNKNIIININDRCTVSHYVSERSYAYISFYRFVSIRMFILWLKVFDIEFEYKESLSFKTVCNEKFDIDVLEDAFDRACEKVLSKSSVNLSVFKDVIFSENIYKIVDILENLKQIESADKIYNLDAKQNELENNESHDYANNDKYILSIIHSEDRIAILNKTSGLWGFVDYSGYLVIDFKYHAVNDFDEGLAVVMLNEKAGVMNRFHEVVLPIIYDEIEWNSVYNVFHISKDSVHSLYDRNGECLSKEYKWIGSFNNSLAVIETFEDKLGFISHRGEELVEPIYINATPFDGDVAMVQTEDNQWHHIDDKANILD